MRKILLVIVAIFMLSNVMAQAAQAGMNKLEDDFVKLGLTAENIKAFEFRAKEKLIDFCNYIELISNKSIDEKLRKHAQTTAINLFTSEDCSIHDSSLPMENSDFNVSGYLQELFQTGYSKIVGEAKNIEVTNSLKPLEENYYSGTIKYVYVAKFYDREGKMIREEEINKQVGFTLTRELKKFGTEEKKIWVVMLCDILTLRN